LIEFINVTKSYPNGDVVIDSLDLVVNPGDFIVITGKSGAGKTTIGRLLIKDLIPNKGKIIFDGEDLAKIPPKKIPLLRRKIGFIFQDFKIIPDKTIGENISIALEIAGFNPSKIQQKVTRLLEMVGLPKKENLFPMQLAGGEIQRASIARAIAADPQVLFADEPTGNLDEQTSIEIFDLLKKINADGTTVIMSTHDVTLIDLHKARHITLQKGKIISDTGGKKKSPENTTKEKIDAKPESKTKK